MDLLTELADKYGTTKGSKSHLYTPFYNRLFEKNRFDVKKVLEIGIENFCSHRMWQEYFPNAEIYGMDIIGKPEEHGVRVFTGSQAKREDLLAMLLSFGGDFDIIIDDGGHRVDAQQISLGILFPSLKPKGCYIIEDLYTSLWGKRFNVLPDESNSTLRFLERIKQSSDFTSPHITVEEMAYFKRWLDNIEIFQRKTPMMTDQAGIPYELHLTAAISKLPF